MKKKVLILIRFYIPGIKGGGPIQSIKNLVESLSDKFDFYLLTSDRDFGDSYPFYRINVNEWTQFEGAKVFYINPQKLTIKNLTRIINNIDYEFLYLNGFFCYRFSIIPILLYKLKKITPKKIILAPRGEFSKGALCFKSTKKKLYITIAKIFGLYNNVMWHATAITEKKDIEAIFGNKVNIQVASNLTANYKGLQYNKTLNKKKGELKIVFISRIHPKKNLKKAISYLKSINGNIEFNIYGPLENKSYWYECEKEIKDLPENIKVLYKGIANHDEIVEIFKKHHVFLFPTLGENYGHVISEALIGGCIVITSDQTPWRWLNKINVGWDIALTDNNAFVKALQYCVDLDDEKYREMSKMAFEYAKIKSNTNSDKKKYLEIFS